MRCLSVKQPWTWAIAAGHKRFENRSWRTVRRGWVWLHASKTKVSGLATSLELPLGRPRPPEGEELAYGAIVGAMKIVNCLSNVDAMRIAQPHEYIYIEGPWCLLVSEVVRFDKPVVWRGALGFFEGPAKGSTEYERCLSELRKLEAPEGLWDEVLK